jgi:hypothetical protein
LESPPASEAPTPGAASTTASAPLSAASAVTGEAGAASTPAAPVGSGPFDLAEALEILARTPRVLDALLRGTAPGWHARFEGGETWGALDVVGHLAIGDEIDWVPRARNVLEHGEAQRFTPFDRFAQETRFAGWTLEQLLDRFAALRDENLRTVRSWNLQPADLERTGTHPAFGRVTLRQLFATWVAHDLGHLVQVTRVMAKRYREEVGPWRAYLRVLGDP